MRSIKTHKPVSVSYRVLEAVIFVDVTGACGQFDSMAETNATPLCERQIRGSDAVHFSRLTAFVDHRLFAEPQPAIIL